MKKIIHIDNSEFFRKLMKSFLEEEGFEVESFDSPQEANIVIGGGGADMVIMGLAFAETGGEEFLARTIASFAGPVIVVSSSVDGKKAKKLIDLGARMALNKSGPWKDVLKPQLSALTK